MEQNRNHIIDTETAARVEEVMFEAVQLADLLEVMSAAFWTQSGAPTEETVGNALASVRTLAERIGGELRVIVETMYGVQDEEE